MYRVRLLGNQTVQLERLLEMSATIEARTVSEWLTVSDLAERFQTSARHIYRMAEVGRFPWGIKFGQLRRWSRRELDVWERAGCPSISDSQWTDCANGDGSYE